MKLSTGQAQAAPAHSPGPLSDALQLGKPRITLLVGVSTALGYALGGMGHAHVEVFAALIVGTLLIGWGNNALNQAMERESDALMLRTRDRPLPSGRVRPRTAVVSGLAATLLGIVLLYLGTTPLAGGIGLAVSVLYVLVYTPLKRFTQLNTLVGAVPGALPPVLGWVAAGNDLGKETLALFLIMFVWQLPHFLPIAWIYRDDYRKAGFSMITVDDPSGGSTRRQMILYTATLVLISLYPTLIGMAGRVYFAGALVLGAGFFAAAMFMVFDLSESRARLALHVSVIYLPLLLGLLVYDASLPQWIPPHTHP